MIGKISKCIPFRGLGFVGLKDSEEDIFHASSFPEITSLSLEERAKYERY
jgi:hypothetical protein